jgi:ketopantoate hydroxymethyltransferase
LKETLMYLTDSAAFPVAADSWRRPLKINLYRDYEVRALARGYAGSMLLRQATRIDCVMVSDSYLMTHLGRGSTKLAEGEQALFLEIMTTLVREVAHSVAQGFAGQPVPYVVGDMPDGAAANREVAIRSAEAMRRAGAEVVKLEVVDERTVDIIQALARRGFRVMAHIGYTPQGGGRSRVGGSAEAAASLFALARRVRSAGAESLVLEKVDELVHRALADHPDSLPTFAIFSGKSDWGGQSVNIWDAVFRPGFKARYFPPTAELDAKEFPAAYTEEQIAQKMVSLLKLVALGEFPLSPPSAFRLEDAAWLAGVNPWAQG